MMIPGLADVALFAWYIGVLVILEGLLSADNALVLAVMVRHLPKEPTAPRAVLGDLGRCRVSRPGPLAGVDSPATLVLQGPRGRATSFTWRSLIFIDARFASTPLR